MNFTINPCKACWKKYNNGNCNINEVNSCVVETEAAFAGVPNNKFARDTANWEECMHKMMKAQGREPCDFQLAPAPVFNQVPHYFPSILSQNGDKDESKHMCIQQCSDLRHNSKSCVNNCITDYNAVIEVSEHASKEGFSKGSRDSSRPVTKEGYVRFGSDGFKKDMKSFVVIAIIFAFVLFVLKKYN